MRSLVLLTLVASNGASGQVAIEPPAVERPVNQSLECIGLDQQNRVQKLGIESRWVEREGTSGVFVTSDTIGLFPEGAWLENLSSIYRDGDRKHGVSLNWQGVRFGWVNAGKVLQIDVAEHGVSSASITVIERHAENGNSPFSYGSFGTLRFAGRCSILVSGQLRTLDNWPRLGRTM